MLCPHCQRIVSAPILASATTGADRALSLRIRMRMSNVFMNGGRCLCAPAFVPEWYMRTSQSNPEGYAATKLIARVDQLKAAPLLIHGLNDTNVHLQDSVNFIEALEAADKPFGFIPLPNRGHSFKGDGLVPALSASVDYFEQCLSTATE